ncbi:35238_t:CDS:2, partial [Racocetra persica]
MEDNDDRIERTSILTIIEDQFVEQTSQSKFDVYIVDSIGDFAAMERLGIRMETYNLSFLSDINATTGL